jgi:signal transduction histidine kinase/CheY-like chemotaxis protein
MKLTHRLWLSAAFPLLALVFVSIQYYRQTTATVLDVAERQLEALPLVRQLYDLLLQVQAQRAHIPQAIVGTVTEAPALVREGASIQAAIDAIARALDKSSTKPLTATAWHETQAKLAPILAAAAQGRLESFDTYLAAAEAIAAQIDAVGLESSFSAGIARSTALNLLLSDLIPHLTDEIGLTRGLTVFHASIEQRTTADITRINSYLSVSKFRFGRVMEKLEDVSDFTPDLARDIEPLQAALDASFKRFAATVDAYLDHDAASDVALVYSQGDEALKNLQAVFDRVFQEVDTVLRRRIGEQRAEMRNAMAAGALGVALCIAVLALVVSSLVRTIHRVVGATERIASGDRKIDVPSPSGRDELSVLGRSISTMYRAICASEEALRREMDRKQLVADISLALQGELSPRALCEVYLRSLGERLGIVAGAVNLCDARAGGTLLVAVYGRADDPVAGGFAPTRGFVGEVLKTGRPLTLTGLSERNAAAAATGLLRVVPESVLLAPVVFESETLAVVEVGVMKPWDADAAAAFDQTLSVFAVRLQASIARHTLEGLYNQTQEQARELEERQRELEAINQDLEQKTQELEQQQVELELVNRQLEGQRAELEERNASVEQARQALEVAQSELERKAGDLEQASRYKSEFLANMSHELRSPLNSILIFSDLLARNERSALLPKEVEFARSINTSGTDLLRLIEDILDLSKVEAGRLDIVAEPFTLEDDLVAELTRTFEPQAAAKGLRLDVEIASDVPRRWRTDRHRLGQVLRNFLSNAIKFTDAGTVTLRIARPAALDPTRGVDPRTAIELAVSDTGIGIKPEDQSKLFVAFQQIDAGSNRRFSGTGLGLSISQRVAGGLGGYVGMRSEPGRGSTFHVVVPCELDGAPSASPAAAEVRTPPAPAPDLPPVPDDRDGIAADDRVMLIVEDDAAFATYLADNCRRRGFKCLVARSGEDGLRLAETFRPSGVILDIKLPGMNGLAVLDRLRSAPATRRTPVHVISAVDFRVDGQKHPHVGYLKKPVTPAQLAAVIDGMDGATGAAGRRIVVLAQAQREREEVAKIVRGHGARVRFAESGAAALDLLKAEPCDGVILDLDCVPEGAVETLRQIKSTAGNERLPVIILSDRELGPVLDTEIARYAGAVVVRGDKAKERLLDEVSLFLHSVDSTAPSQAPRELATTTSTFKGRHVLLVDDDMRNLFAIMTVLEAQGMTVQTATNGREALAALEGQETFDLVLMDMMMPEVDGYEAMRRIRTQERFQKLPIIALTARAMKGERDDCLAAGASDYLAKPLKIDQLLALISLWLA